MSGESYTVKVSMWDAVRRGKKAYGMQPIMAEKAYGMRSIVVDKAW